MSWRAECRRSIISSGGKPSTVVPAPRRTKQLHELGQQEWSFRSGSTVDDGCSDVGTVEADDDVHVLKRASLQPARAVLGEVDLELPRDLDSRLKGRI